MSLKDAAEAPKYDVSNCQFYKLPYIGFYSSYTISSIINKYCKDLNAKVIFSPFKLSKIFVKIVKIIIMYLVLNIIDTANSFYQLKIKESFHIEQLKPELNKQVEHVSLALHF